MNYGDMKKKYNFFLNQYTGYAFSKCPKCENKTKVRKLPLTIILTMEKMILNLNKTCKFCPYCDLIIARKKEIEDLLLSMTHKKLSEKDYFVMGTIERSIYLKLKNRSSNKIDDHFLGNVFVFKNVWDFKFGPAWVKRD